MPEEYNAVADGKIKAADCTGNIVLDESANLYKGELNDWFYTPDELTVTFTVVTGEGDDAVSDDYEVAFTNATAIPWCPGELNDGQYGHYDLSCTIYLTGYDRYTDRKRRPQTVRTAGQAIWKRWQKVVMQEL